MIAEVVAIKAMLAALLSEVCDHGRNAEEATKMLEKIKATTLGALDRMNFDADEGTDTNRLRAEARSSIEQTFSAISFTD